MMQRLWIVVALGAASFSVSGCPRAPDARSHNDASIPSAKVSAADAADALEGVVPTEGMTRERFARCKVRAVTCESTGNAADAAACRPRAEITWNNPPLSPAWGTIPFSPRPTDRARATDPRACCYVDFFCPDAAPEATTTPAAVLTCPEVAHSFRATWKRATGTCAADAECACYNPVIEEAGCGGVTDRATATALASIEKSFHAASCPWPHVCAAQTCSPQCVAGRCVNQVRTQ